MEGEDEATRHAAAERAAAEGATAGSALPALPLHAVVVRGGRAWVELPAPPSGHTWRVESAADGGSTWRAVAASLEGGSHILPEDAPASRHDAWWRAVAVPDLSPALAGWSAELRTLRATYPDPATVPDAAARSLGDAWVGVPGADLVALIRALDADEAAWITDVWRR